jgi:hypothetical protein
MLLQVLTEDTLRTGGIAGVEAIQRYRVIQIHNILEPLHETGIELSGDRLRHSAQFRTNGRLMQHRVVVLLCQLQQQEWQ